MKREKKGGWECLPGELIACILERLEDDFKAISAVRGVCKHWNQSSLLLTALTPTSYPCNKHITICTCYYIISLGGSCNKHKGCTCCSTSLTNFISKATSLRKLDLHGWRGDVSSEDILEACDWTSLRRTVHTLRTGSLRSERTTRLLLDCHSLAELHINGWSYCLLSFELELVARLRKLNIHGYLPNKLLTSIPLTNMEELSIYDEDKERRKYEHMTVTLKGPKLLKVYVNLYVDLVNVEAPLLSSLKVTGRGRLHVSDACQCETVTIGPRILLVHAPECVKKLGIQDGLSGIMETLLSCRAIPRITNLCLMPLAFSMSEALCADDRDDAELFFEVVGSLAELEELKVNTFFLTLLAGSVPSSLECFLPSLKVFTLDMTIEDIVDTYLDDVDEFVDAVVNTLKELKGLFGATVHMKMEHSSAVCVKRKDVVQALQAFQTVVAGLFSR